MLKKLILKGIYCFVLTFALSFNTQNTYAQQRTDGPENEEFKGNTTRLSGGYGTAIGLDVGADFLNSSDRCGGCQKSGIGFGAHVEYFIDEMFSLNFAIMDAIHSGSGGSGSINNLSFDIGPRGRLMFDPIAPFLSIQPGFTWQKIGSSGSAFSFMLDFGSGLDLLVSDHVTMGLTYKYHLVFDQDTGSSGIGTQDFQTLMLKVDYNF